ncbi:MAG: HAMP domain-containing sensor histidine kinase [Nocardioidaceae bacterium]
MVATTASATFVAATVLAVGLQLLLAHQSESDSLQVLRSRVDAAASTIRFTGHGVRVLEVPSAVLDQNLWVYQGSRRIDGGQPRAALRSAVDRLSTTATERTTVVRGYLRLFARWVPSPDGRRGVVVVAALDLTPYEKAERRSLWLSLALGALAVVAAAVAAWFAAAASLRQVRRMARRADAWREHDLSGRFALGPPHDELTELAHTLDRMLDRIGQALLAERRLTDEVAHELRTPLAVIRTEAQLALSRLGPGADADPAAESLRAIVAATERMADSIGTMLAVARAAHGEDDSCHVADVLGRVATAAPDHPGVLVDVDTDRTDALVAAPLAVVTAALAPLVDNGLRHARSTVRLHAERVGDRVHVLVADDGPGVPEHLRHAVFEPGRTTSPDGAGLGLPLARRLARAAGGDVRLGEGPGAVFVVDLPAG